MRPLPFNLEDLRAFATVIEAGGFARAAKRIGVSKSVLSRRVSGLEHALGAQLLVRGQSGARATEAGAAFHRTAADVLSRLDEARDDAVAAKAELAGPIRITAPHSFGVIHLAPALAAFASAHPKVGLDVRLDDRVLDLLGGGFDLGIRIGDVPAVPLAARLLAPVKAHVLASPAYLTRRGRPTAPADLAGHDVLEYANAGLEPWRASFGPGLDAGRLHVRFRSDNGEMLRDAAVAGMGLVILPGFLATGAIKSGRLETVLPGHPTAEAGVYAVSPPGRQAPRRVRALVEHLAMAFGPEPPWEAA